MSFDSTGDATAVVSIGEVGGVGSGRRVWPLELSVGLATVGASLRDACLVSSVSSVAARRSLAALPLAARRWTAPRRRTVPSVTAPCAAAAADSCPRALAVDKSDSACEGTRMRARNSSSPACLTNDAVLLPSRSRCGPDRPALRALGESTEFMPSEMVKFVDPMRSCPRVRPEKGG